MAEFQRRYDQQLGTITLNLKLMADDDGNVYVELDNIPDKAIPTEALWQITTLGISWKALGSKVFDKLVEAYGRRPNKQ